MSQEIASIVEKCLSQIAAGEATVQSCLDRYPALADEMEPLLLAAEAVRRMPKPALTLEARARIEARLLDATDVQYKENTMQTPAPQKTHNASAFSLRNWLRLPVVFSGLAVLLLIGVLVVVVGLGIFEQSPRDAQVAQGPFPASTSEANTVSSSPAAPTPETIVQSPATPQALESSHTVFVPIVAATGHPQRATLKDVRGLVQVQTSDDAWTTVSVAQAVAAGQRIRTGELSSARLVFYDGSQVRLGPGTEVSVDELDARQSDGPRIVALTQWVGETDHQVATANQTNSRYEVRTPSASGVARGTSFHVRVTPDQRTRFSVDEGSVAVTGLNVTVSVLAGQSTVVSADQTPDEPAFRITGEGKVSQIGTTWIIAGQSFQTHDHTVIVGNPQVGDWVFVEGHLLADDTRVADWIVLLRRSPANRFAITGRVDAIGDTEWTVAGQVIGINDETEIEGDIEAGDLASVEGVVLEGGTLLAEQIRLVEEDAPGLPFDFVGVVQEIADEAWTISGVTVAVSTTTEIDEGLAVGDIVHVRGWILQDGSWLATAIERVEEDESTFEFTGEVEGIDPWVVAGISFETDEWTEIEAGIEVGDRVRVQGRILEDGTWLATEIEQLDEDDQGLRLVFVGTVDGMDPWVVSGIPLTANEKTVVEGDVEVGDLVRVEVEILPDGTWLATRITLISDAEVGLGCLYVTAVVTGVSADQLELLNWPIVSLEGVPVEGELKVGSVVLLHICIDADGTIHVMSVIVIYEPEPIVVPPSPPAPPPPGDDDKVTICHKPNSKNPHTITVSRSALQAHLAHGDTIGPCK